MLQVGSIILSILFFDETVLKPITIPNAAGSEFKAGKSLMQDIVKMEQNVAGLLMLATPMSMDVAKLFSGMSEEHFDFPIFGGGAGAYDPSQTSMVFLDREYFSEGAIGVVFLSKKLHIYTNTFLGWKPLSKELTITDTDGSLLKKIDGELAYNVYNRYLNIANDKNFFDNALEFPILLQRNGETIARVPFFADERGYIGFRADLAPDEKFHIGYGDPNSILQNSIEVQKELYEFEADAILLYACVCQRFLMQNDVNLETQPFDLIAPTAGFYTHGEFFSKNNSVHLLNSTIVVVGLREGEIGHIPRRTLEIDTADALDIVGLDPYSNKHNRIISKLLHFIGAVTSELEQANSELKRISGLDKLTQIYNRLTLDEILNDEIYRSEREGADLSVLMLDVDKFKWVNDGYGHLAGDKALVRIAEILTANIRSSDSVGRWGGEEFLIILPDTDISNAMVIAERIRAAVDKEGFIGVGHITCSIGAAMYNRGDNLEKLLLRADKALYEAKNGGRNTAASARDEAEPSH